jgi:hypothetical protein
MKLLWCLNRTVISNDDESMNAMQDENIVTIDDDATKKLLRERRIAPVL